VVLQTPYADTEDSQDVVSETREPSWAADLPPNPFYFLIIEAHGARAEVGRLRRRGRRTTGADAMTAGAAASPRR